jgi:DNA-binding LacI/PurR family transcriptional regulator
VERLGFGPALVHESDWTAEGGRAAILALPERDHPTAIIAAGDTSAAGAILGARERGWTVPGDVSVTGWDNNELGAYLEPTLTTVNVDHRKLGRAAMSRLVTTLQPAIATRGSDPSLDGPLNTIIWRNSIGPAPI